MKIATFETEHFFARYEFNTPYQLCNSDCESVSIKELLDLAGGSTDQLGEERLVYTEPRGSAGLRNAIAAMHSTVSADDVVVLGTPVEGIFLAANALLEPGDEVIVMTPAYDALTKMFEHVAGENRVKRWEITAAPGSWQLDLEALRTLMTTDTRLVVVNFPHNPTGYLPSPDFMTALCALIEENEAWLFCDEMYFGLVQPATNPVPSAADISSRAIVLSGLSKTYGLPGLRCGWLVVKDPTVQQNIMNWKYYTSICPPVPTEYLAVAALRVWEILRDRNIARIGNNLDLAEAFFDRWPEWFNWRRPVAGSTALVGYNVPSVEAVSAKLATEEGILIQSARMFGSNDRHMRMGFGRDSFPEALEKFEHWLERQAGSGGCG
ncbi:MAG: pyridoxal phosphate-dependent aminotransferase [Xanthomonadales bacterium]|nr:pyridoxal phosphate-dependent aminotransferase [Gammaproteobacteria bacterium]NND58270.1 pyridoxal phosphate-dependent aminotransferase [Xanthomonadales bacterium]NNK52019.1 pyridoxal phosphate-dependent aminotransferase [Xanthomonadales bacterium]